VLGCVVSLLRMSHALICSAMLQRVPITAVAQAAALPHTVHFAVALATILT
jgi:hypothetical protein